MAGATFSRLKVWVHEKLKAADLNAEFNNILNNLTPAGIDDLSVSAGEMQGQTAPFPGSVISQATSLAGELQRLRYQLNAIMGTTYWYEAPASTVLAMAATLSGLGQWVLDAATPTYINGTSFSVPTDRTAEFTPGRRIQAVVTAGTVYGTVVSANASGAPTITTIVLLMDSVALDNGLSSFSLGMITTANNALPNLVPSTKTDDYTLAIGDNRNILIANKDTEIAFTLGAYTGFPLGWSCRIKNIGAGVLTLAGTVDGVTNPTMMTNDELFVYNDGIAWRGLIKAVTGPSANTENYIPQWNGTDGRKLKNGLKIGVEANNIPQMTATAKYPLADGSLLTNLNVIESSIGSSAVSQSKLKTSTGEVSLTSSTYNDIIVEADLVLPGGEYGFFPQTKCVGVTDVMPTVSLGMGGVNYQIIIHLTAKSKLMATTYLTSTAYARQRYVTSSGEINWLFMLRDKDTKQVSASWYSSDHPCMGNGGDPELVPHPFPDYDAQVDEIICINPTDKELDAIKAKIPKGGSVLQTINENYTIDDEQKEEAAWPTKEITVGLPEGYDWKMGGEIAPIKTVIPKPSGVLRRTLKAKAVNKDIK